MIGFSLIDPFAFKDDILSIGNQAFGDGYLNSVFDLANDVRCIGALDKGRLIGFVFYYAVDVEVISSFDVTLLFQPSRQVVYLKSVIVHPDYRRQKIATNLIAAIEVMGEKQGITHYYAEAWSTLTGLTSGLLFEKLGYRIVRQIDHFWFDDSLIQGYACSECGQAPCCCSAVIFVKGRLI
jgi:ribosomal protein S18 acetylase RimI-like enzyme